MSFVILEETGYKDFKSYYNKDNSAEYTCFVLEFSSYGFTDIYTRKANTDGQNAYYACGE